MGHGHPGPCRGPGEMAAAGPGKGGTGSTAAASPAVGEPAGEVMTRTP